MRSVRLPSPCSWPGAAVEHGAKAGAQIQAFEDTWTWGEAASSPYEEILESGGRVSQAMQAFRTFLSESDTRSRRTRCHADAGRQPERPKNP